MRSASDCATPIIGMDFFPTLLHLAGAPLDHAVDGLDLCPLWSNDAAADAPIRTRDALYWHYPHYWGGRFPGCVGSDLSRLTISCAHGFYVPSRHCRSCHC